MAHRVGRYKPGTKGKQVDILIPGTGIDKAYGAFFRFSGNAFFGSFVGDVSLDFLPHDGAKGMDTLVVIKEERKGKKPQRGDKPTNSRLIGYLPTAFLVALVLGAVAEQLVFWLVLFAWAGLGAALGPTTLLALYWKRTTRAGIFAGLLSGTLTTFIWYLTPSLKARLYELIPAFLVSLLATVVVSLRTRPPADTHELMTSMEHD